MRSRLLSDLLLRVLRRRVTGSGVHALRVVAVDQFVLLRLEAGCRGRNLLLLLRLAAGSIGEGEGLPRHVGGLLLLNRVLIDGVGRRRLHDLLRRLGRLLGSSLLLRDLRSLLAVDVLLLRGSSSLLVMLLRLGRRYAS